MAYTSPTYYEFEDTTSEAALDVLANNCDEIVDLDIDISLADCGPATGTQKQAWLVHGHPWLFYISEDEDNPGIIHPLSTAIDDDTSLPYSATGAYYALDENLFWMVIGTVYQVEHVKVAIEVWDLDLSTLAMPED